jgi:hypothetical protein
MGLAEDIRALCDRSLAALNETYDYSSDTKAVWRFAQRLPVAERPRAIIRDRETGQQVSELDLAHRAQLYITDFLLPQTFQQFVSQFEVFYFDLLRLRLDHNPGSLSAKQVEFKQILSTPNLADIRRSVIDKELNDVKYKPVRDWFAYLQTKFGVAPPPVEQVERIAEIKASRDILAHNAGIVNAIYLEKAGRLARYGREGERLEITQQYHRKSWEHIRDVVRTITTAAHEKAGG